MKKTIKKFLSTVLALSLLAGFSASVASFATDEEYVKEVDFKGYGGYMVDVDNSKVAEKLGLSVDYGEMIIDIIIIEDKAFIEGISTDVPVLYIPDTLGGKKLVIDEKIFRAFSWPQKDDSRIICVPSEMVDTFKNIAKRPYGKRWANFGVISYEDLFVQHLFD